MSDQPMEIQGMDELRRRFGLAASAKDIERYASNAFRKAARRIQKTAREDARTKGAIKTIFGKKAGALSKLYTVGRVERDGGLNIKIKVKGMGAIQETGGRTRPHPINPREGKKLAFITKGQLIVTPKAVSHPGAQHPKMASMVPTLARQQASVFTDVAEAIRTHLEAAARG